MSLQNLIDQKRQHHDLPHVCAVVGSAQGGVSEVAASGSSGGAQVAPDAIYRIASMTKTVVSVAALRLVDQGVLQLREPVGGLLPELHEPNILTGFDGDEPTYTKAQTPITLHHLLTHTSGLGYEFMHPLLYKLVELGKVDSVLAGQPNFIAQPLIAEPGTAFNYSISTDWLGVLVARAAGTTLGEYLETEIFAPLGMKDTGFSVPESERGRLVQGAMPTPEGWIDIPMPGGDAPAFESGGGGLYSTAQDYFAFCRMLLCGGSLNGHKVLAEATVAELSKDHLSPLEFPVFKATTPVFAEDIEHYPGMRKTWSLGGLVLTSGIPGGRSPASHCWSGIFNTYYWVDPQAGKAGIALMQISPYYHPGCVDLFEAVEQYAYSG